MFANLIGFMQIGLQWMGTQNNIDVWQKGETENNLFNSYRYNGPASFHDTN
jgi:hypothetical protein